jgi:hypothetical protein
LKESREQDEIEKLGTKHRCLLPNSEIREQDRSNPDHLLPNSDHLIPSSDHLIPSSDHLIPSSDHLLPKSQIREQLPKKLSNDEIREQIEQGGEILGKSIVNVKGQKYLLTHSKSDKHMPTNKGWLDIKRKDGKLYLYLRWRDAGIQRSRCMGRLDHLC